MSSISSKRWNLVRSKIMKNTSSTNEMETIHTHHFHLFIYKETAVDNKKLRTYSINLNDYNISKQIVNIEYEIPIVSSLQASDTYNIDTTGYVCIWPSEEILAYLILLNAEKFKGKKILEVGSGVSGLAGFCSALCNAENVCITDGNERTSEILKSNVITNIDTFGDKVESKRLLWGRNVDAKKYDCIIVADCLFFVDFHDSLLQTFESYLNNSGFVWILGPKRGDTMSKFLDKCESYKLNYRVETAAIYCPELNEKIEKENDNSNFKPDLHSPILITLTKKI